MPAPLEIGTLFKILWYFAENGGMYLCFSNYATSCSEHCINAFENGASGEESNSAIPVLHACAIYSEHLATQCPCKVEGE